MPAVGSSVLADAGQFSLEHVFKPELVQTLVKLSVILVQGVISQVDVMVLVALGRIVLFTREPNEPIIEKEQLHRTDCAGYQHINSEIVLVALVESWLPNVLLDYVLNLILFDLAVVQLILLLLGDWKAVLLGRLYTLLYLQVFDHVLAVVLLVFVQLNPQLFDLVHDEDALALRA